MYIPKQYIQKSKHFLFPLAGFRSNEIVDPAGTYLYWNSHESIENYELIVYYKRNYGRVFEEYESRVLAHHPLLTGCYTVEEGNVYIFDLMDYSNDINWFLEGKYSKMHAKTKRIIRIYNQDFEDSRSPREGRYFHMVFHPDVYYGVVSQELAIPASTLEKGVELCPKFDKLKETLTINIINKGNCYNLRKFSDKQIEFS